MFSDTIVALASASGRAGVAVLRLSGAGAREALLKIGVPASLPEPRRAVLRDIVDFRSHEVIDHALVLFFPAPHSFTGEDVVELHLHGGRAILHATLDLLCSLPSLRPAEAGEFSRRAFANGKMDLTEAEGIADLVDAETSAQRRQALRQMDGDLGRLYFGWAERLTHNLAYIEAEIDFADEEVPSDLAEGRREDIAALAREIAAHLDDGHRGERLREGFTVALLGAPNAGKSSLLNALARREAAIVSPVAGTTRDIIEVQLDLGGYPVILADTAGLRETADAIESEGVRRALARAEQADLKILVFDGSCAVPLDPATQALIDESSLLVINKRDVMLDDPPPTKNTNSPINSFMSTFCSNVPPPYPAYGLDSLRSQAPRGGGDSSVFVAAKFSQWFRAKKVNPACATKAEGVPSPSRGLTPKGVKAVGWIGRGDANTGFFKGVTSLGGRSSTPLLVSAKTGEGLALLTQHLVQEIEKRFVSTGGPALTRVRHRVALEESVDHLRRALAAPEVELCAEDLRLAIRALGRITGTVDVEDLLDIIFSSFCIGK